MDMTQIVEITAHTLAGVDAFRELDLTAREVVARHCRGYRYPAGTEVVHHCAESSDVYFVVSGTVRVTLFSECGKEVAFRDLSAGQAFGDISAIDGKPRSADVITLEESVLCSVCAESFKAVVREFPEVADRVMLGLAELIRALTERVIEFSTLGVNNRLHAELFRLGREHCGGRNVGEIRPAPTHAEFASRISCGREGVTRELNRLERQGVIERPHGVIIIPDMGRLERMVSNVQEA